ncbi:CHRNA2 [Mytilus coruscus]|uniref:CHRNA2 n=1 Tax=Mytilus coruscus TaxID=42192 RepID=A0A6J8A7H7_MYTCO|nr:CHRNA2 [Mytilus coruscus]
MRKTLGQPSRDKYLMKNMILCGGFDIWPNRVCSNCLASNFLSERMSAKLSAVLVLICVLWFGNTYARREGTVHVKEDEAITKVLKDYDKYAYPGTTEHPIVKVMHGLNLEKMDYDSMKSKMSIEVWSELKWNDPRLTWSGTPARIRLPIPNTKPLYNPNVVVSRNGDVVLVPDAKYDTDNCKQKNDDVIECKFKFGSWTYGADEIDLQAISPRVIMETYTENAEYEIVGSSAVREARKYDSFPETYDDIVYTIQIKRR